MVPLPPGSPGGAYAPSAQPDTARTRLKAAYAALTKNLGVENLPWNDPRVLMLYQAIGHLTPDQAYQASKTVADSYHDPNRGPLADYEIDSLLDTVRGQGQAENEYDPITGIGKALASGYQDLRRLYGAPMDDPNQGNFATNDPRLVKMVQDVGQQYGVTFTPEQVAQLGQSGQLWKTGTGAGIPDDAVDWYAGQVAQRKILAPHQMNPATWDALGQTGQQLYLSAAAAKGYDPNDYQQRLNAARPVGQVGRTGRVDFAQNLAGVY